MRAWALPWRWWRRVVVGSVEHGAVLARVHADSGFSGRYAFLVIVSGLIAILGLLLPSSAVLIGAMLISPLMMPIIGLGFGIATFDLAEIRRAAFALAAGAAIAVLLCAGFVALSPVQTVTSEIAARTKPNLFDLLVALLSAVAGGYALIRGRGETVVGVAIAIALMPPLAVVGFGIATLNGTVAGGALLLFLTNLVTIALTAAVMARLYGFGGHLSPSQTRLQGLLIILGLVALAVPLGIALRQIAWEALAQRQVREAIRASFPREARISQLDIDFAGRPERIRAVVFTPALRTDGDAMAGAAIRAALGHAVDVHVDQVRVGGESGASESAQIAAAQSRERERSEADLLRDRLALVAGDANAVLLDGTARRAEVRAAPLPGASLASYRALEQRVAATVPDWQVTLLPPAAPLPPVGFDGEVPDAAGLAALDTAIWGARRLHLPIGVSGRRADLVIARLEAAGIAAVRLPGNGAQAALAWQAPAP
ncbi:DUF389 domain-containing protein [Sphingomonas sp. CBMAI 2297]|uniref:DUF389 domain-containing protein n=1 Tax=Sphingomonas sp. CBMAI 2297 TaxID=2991720 RepID=UPI002457A926|nr:DUF389 domain-containing protein [Sphingomonas sp. CBMAI 2297]MDH4742408.1 DUF389 domain-containing protein [Sphingomonas sp. CBMAI 2297]